MAPIIENESSWVHLVFLLEHFLGIFLSSIRVSVNRKHGFHAILIALTQIRCPSHRNQVLEASAKWP